MQRGALGLLPIHPGAPQQRALSPWVNCAISTCLNTVEVCAVQLLETYAVANKCTSSAFGSSSIAELRISPEVILADDACSSVSMQCLDFSSKAQLCFHHAVADSARTLKCAAGSRGETR